MALKIHPTAIVHPKAVIDGSVSIGPFSIVEEDVTIAAGAVIGPHVTIGQYTTVGPGCSIYDNAVLGGLPQDLTFKPDTKSYVRIGANCIIREGVTIHRGTKPDTATEVGNNCFLMVNSHVAHNVKLGQHVILVNGVLLGGYVEVGDRVFIGGNCGVHQFARIGRLAMLGGASSISQDVPPFCMTVSGRLNALAGLNVVGMRRAGINVAERQAIKQAFQVLFQSGLNFSQTLEKLKTEKLTEHVRELYRFVATSRRGVCKLD